MQAEPARQFSGKACESSRTTGRKQEEEDARNGRKLGYSGQRVVTIRSAHDALLTISLLLPLTAASAPAYARYTVTPAARAKLERDQRCAIRAVPSPDEGCGRKWRRWPPRSSDRLVTGAMDLVCVLAIVVLALAVATLAKYLGSGSQPGPE